MYKGQAQQDKFVINILKGKKNGIFLEIGSNDPIEINNTYLLESQYGWSGIMVEMEEKYLPLYKQHRKNSIYVINDATKIDYRNLFLSNNVPFDMDYLQIDLEAKNGSTLHTLQKLDNEVLHTYKFATITFEHDRYSNNFENTREKSREIFKKRGYFCVFEDIHNIYPKFVYEDWYVHPSLVDMNYVNKLMQLNRKNYVYNPITEKSIDWQSIDYNII
jgi:hypothetical protein